MDWSHGFGFGNQVTSKQQIRVNLDLFPYIFQPNSMAIFVFFFFVHYLLIRSIVYQISFPFYYFVNGWKRDLFHSCVGWICFHNLTRCLFIYLNVLFRMFIYSIGPDPAQFIFHYIRCLFCINHLVFV